jgi:hypothetical protein
MSKLHFNLLRYYNHEGDYACVTKNNQTWFYGTTLGALVEEKQGQLQKPFCVTLERPLFYEGTANARDNKLTKNINESCCINVGTYTLKWTYSPTFKKHMYLVNAVGGRSGIRVHSANDINDLLGCIALGFGIVTNTRSGDGFYYDYIITESRKAVAKFEQYCNGADVELTIQDLDQAGNYKLISPFIKAAKS